MCLNRNLFGDPTILVLKSILLSLAFTVRSCQSSHLCSSCASENKAGDSHHHCVHWLLCVYNVKQVASWLETKERLVSSIHLFKMCQKERTTNFSSIQYFCLFQTRALCFSDACIISIMMTCFYRYDQLPEVQLHAVTQRHLVGFSMQNDLLPLVLSHCNYSLHLGHGDNATSTKLDYDFRGFELQLKSNLLLSKCWVHRGEHGDMQVDGIFLFFCELECVKNERFLARLPPAVQPYVTEDSVFWSVCDLLCELRISVIRLKP